MASYDTEESSVEGSRPYEIYRFLLGSEEFLYTSAEDDVIVDGSTFEALPIQRSQIGLGKTERTQILTVDLPISNVLAQRYIGPPPGVRAALTIFRLQRGDTGVDTALIYSGTVKSVIFPKNGTLAKMQVQSIEASSNRMVPRFTFMGMCNHVLYGTACGVSPSGFTHIGLVTLVDSNQLTIAGLNATGLNFRGGYVDSADGSEKRQILAQTGDIITILLPFEVDPDGTSVSALAGCDKVLKSDCAVTFGNEINFGGFAFVPRSNIFIAGL